MQFSKSSLVGAFVFLNAIFLVEIKGDSEIGGNGKNANLVWNLKHPKSLKLEIMFDEKEPENEHWNCLKRVPVPENFPEITDDDFKTQNFSTLIKRLTIDETEKFLNHPLYTEIGRGTLPKSKFRLFLIQDHFYILDYFQSARIDVEKETDPEKKEFLNGQLGYDWKLFKYYYNKWNFTLDTEKRPYTHSIGNSVIAASSFGSVAEGLATKYPCWLLWDRMTEKNLAVADLPNIPGHEYKYFWDHLNEFKSANYIEGFRNKLEEYFSEAGTDVKKAMLQGWVNGVKQELIFADGIFNDEKFHFEV